jgi:anaerobic selenocysteine-containing dehydrogenase
MGRTMRFGRFELDPATSPTTDDLLGVLLKNARIPLDEVKAHPHGARFVDDTITVGPGDPSGGGRLDIGSEPMMRDLTELAAAPPAPDDTTWPFRLISRRMLHVQNSMLRGYAANRPRHNPAFLNPDDMAELGVIEGDLVEIESIRARITGVAAPEPGLRRGVVSMSHGYGDLPGDEAADGSNGASTSLLVDVDHDHDRYSGQPRMSDVPVRLRRVAAVAPR